MNVFDCKDVFLIQHEYLLLLFTFRITTLTSLPQHCNANKAELNLKRTYDVGVCVPSFICVDQIVSCWSVQRADRDRLPYGNTGRRERDER